ncbi:ABC transporter permease [Paenibacillus pinihumi]|uniref:ABC transporter permease n=1 Tax=Paenibacillus pinihumi TaxID=669462 RepID=UPI00041E2054|nr:ABC transporter permease [Paenibacillus pinihumi]
MTSILRSEWLKLRRSKMWLLLFVSPLIAGLSGSMISMPADLPPWLYLQTTVFYTHALLLLPLLTGVFSAFICRYEHIHGGWKQLLALPVSRSSVYLVKLIVVMWLLAAVQLLTAASLYAAGLIQGVEESFPWSSVLINIAAGWAACLPLAALQLAVSTAWSSFAAPLAVNVIFTLPNLLVAHSRDYGPFYPWVQPLLAMMPGHLEIGAFMVPPQTLFTVVLVSFAIFLAGGLAYFTRRAI